MSTKQDCMYMIKQLHDTIEKRMNQALSKYDLTMIQMRALVLLHKKKQDSCTLKEFEQILHIAQSTTAGVVKRLEQKGYVETAMDSRDRRIKNVQITPEGLKLCRHATKEVECMVEQLFDGLSEEEMQTFIGFIEKICIEINHM